ncbi:MAG: cupin domain-containing protein [Burkholderiales bacterium]|nr:cupin domain-containing protein [Burkholderiales bacterium]
MLGDLTPSEFLREYWHKKPLLIRSAFPGFKGLLSPEALVELSCMEETQSRLVTCDNGTWSLENGPFEKKDFRRLPKFWTLLVQGVNHFVVEGERLLMQFDFVPRARLDDLMVSFAPDGCGVGPHFDSYDVFLLQGMGKRKWQISANQDQDLIPDAPLRILSRFEPTEEWVLEPGDMLYLPPKYAHNGIAIGDSMTYSIGFRAPSYQELATQFLVHLQDHIEIDGMYEDPDLEKQDHPAQIGKGMLQKISGILKRISWDDGEVERFIGVYLSEPKPHLFFDPPDRPVSKKKFLDTMEKDGIHLDLKSQMFFTQDNVFINGEILAFGNLDRLFLMSLADNRESDPEKTDAQTGALLYQWYKDGYIGTGRLFRE